MYDLSDNSNHSNDTVVVMMEKSPSEILQIIHEKLKNDNPKLVKSNQIGAWLELKSTDKEVILFTEIQWDYGNEQSYEKILLAQQDFKTKWDNSDRSVKQVPVNITMLIEEQLLDLKFNPNSKDMTEVELLQLFQPFKIVRGFHHVSNIMHSNIKVPLKIISCLPVGTIMKAGVPKEMTPMNVIEEVLIAAVSLDPSHLRFVVFFVFGGILFCFCGVFFVFVSEWCLLLVTVCF